MNKTLAQSTGARDSGVQEVACLAKLLALCERNNKFLSRALGKALSSQQITQVSKYAVYTVSVYHCWKNGILQRPSCQMYCTMN